MNVGKVENIFIKPYVFILYICASKK